MKIKDTAITIDMSKITLHSNSPRNVELPYTGKLPADLDATTARIAFNIQAGRPTRVIISYFNQLHIMLFWIFV